MARMIRFKDLISLGKPKGPGFGISSQFYLSVLAVRPVLPALLVILNPKGEGGAVKGFGVPLRKDAEREDLGQPLIRGFYALATPDQKTVLRLTVVGKEEAGFDPAPMLASPSGQALAPEVRHRIAAAWNLMQVTFESHDPAVYPALDFLQAVVARAADLTEGVVADPISQAYRLPEDVVAPHDQGLPFSTEAHVAVRELPGKTGLHLSTLGLSKFALPELEIYGVDPSVLHAGRLLLLGAAQTCLQGKKIEAGDRLGASSAPLRVAEGGLDRRLWDGIPCLELIPEGSGTVSANLLAWQDSRRG